MGFEASVDLEDGLRRTVEWFRDSIGQQDGETESAQPVGERI